MTEQEKSRGRAFVISIMVAMFALVVGAFIWMALSEPPAPSIVELGDRYVVRWGNRFEPFEFQYWKDGSEVVLTMNNMSFDKHHLKCAPAEVYRRLFEGWTLLDEFHSRKRDAAP